MVVLLGLASRLRCVVEVSVCLEQLLCASAEQASAISLFVNLLGCVTEESCVLKV